MGSRKPPLLYCFPRRSTFIQRDIDGLSQRHDVRTHELKALPAWQLPFRLLHQFAWLVRNKAWKRDCICHFSGYHALLPSWICHRTFIILAGTDCASIPAIRYGDHSRRLMGWATRKAAAMATRLLPVHASLMYRTQAYSDIVPAEQGILAFGPDIKTPWSEIPYGFDAEFWKPDLEITKDPEGFICVPGAASPTNGSHLLKGVKLVLEIAERLPAARFVVVGVADPADYKNASSNVNFLGRVDAFALRNLFCKASFHLQLSLSEGMPNALCEAMLCGCIPLVSEIASMPDIVDGIGYVLQRDDPEMGAALGSAMLALPANERSDRAIAARNKMAQAYSMWARLDALEALLHDHP